MPKLHVHKLDAIQDKIKALREEEEKIHQEMIHHLSTCLKASNAFQISFDVLLGGILDVIDQANADPSKKEAWKVSGEKFRKRVHRATTQHSAQKAKKVA